MAGLLYFVPEARTPAEVTAKLTEAGAHHATEARPQYNQVTGGTLFGGPGYVLGWGTNYLLKPDEQEWVRAPGGYWIGRSKTSPPTPEDLAREKQLDGHRVALADGNRWLVPVARLFTTDAGVPALPRTVKLDPDGTKRFQVRSGFEWLWGLACEFWDEWMAAINENAEPPDAFKWVARGAENSIVTRLDSCFDLTARILGVNYRVGPAEVSFLELFDSDIGADVPLALVDWPSVMEHLGKKA